MIPTAGAVHRAVRTNVRLLLDTIDGLPDDAFNDWRPAASDERGLNTFAAIAVHTVAASAFHTLHTVGGAPSDRVRAEEFRATATLEEVRTRFAAFLDDVDGLLDGLTDADLSGPTPVRHPAWEEGWTRLDWLLHGVEHIALHAGHLEIQRQVWEAEAGA